MWQRVNLDIGRAKWRGQLVCTCFVGVCVGSEAGVRAKISGKCVCVSESKACTDGQKQNVACRHTMRTRRE